MPITRTLNPLPFHDLEPRRFEDLVRQLVYDFRPWLRLEATGRAGSDDGFDIRGIERGGAVSEIQDSDEGPNNDVYNEVTEADAERVWLVQCKREKKIGPTQLSNYLGAIPTSERSKLYGVIFVACCDFSKRSRDIMADWCRTNGISEFQIWSVSDIETMLMQPKNDHILFAFFGISLQIRKRSIGASIKGRISTKRKLHRVLQGRVHSPFILRDPEADNYPYANPDAKPSWLVRENRDMDYRGIGFLWKEYYAYCNDADEWDVANGFNRALVQHDNPWASSEDRYCAEADRGELMKFMSEMEASNRAMLTATIFVPFEEIVAIDELGDDSMGRGLPTLFVPMKDGRPPMHHHADVVLTRSFSTDVEVNNKKRVKIFPAKFRRDEFE